MEKSEEPLPLVFRLNTEHADNWIETLSFIREHFRNSASHMHMTDSPEDAVMSLTSYILDHLWNHKSDLCHRAPQA